jgi:predicted nucleic acid-binding protein
MGDTRLSEGYEKILTSSSEFSVLPVQRDILIDAARLRSGLSSLRLPDAIHVATARASRCSVFVSNDRRLRRIGDVRMVALSPFTVDDILGHAS